MGGDETAEQHEYSRAFLVAQWVITALASLTAGTALVVGGSAGQGTWAASLSRGALLLSLLPLVLAGMAVYCICCVLLRSDRQDPISAGIAASAARRRLLSRLGGAGMLVGVLWCFVPSYAVGELSGFQTRGLPLAALGGLLGLQSVLVGRFWNWRELLDPAARFLRYRHQVLATAFWILAACIGVWIFVALTGLGISGQEDYWYEAGVPVLAAQIALAVLAALGFRHVEARLRQALGARLDAVVFAGVWIFAAILWAATPVEASYFNPRPRSPNREMFPFSDAGTYDLQSQSALLGYGLDYGRAIDNPLYPSFLVLVHMVAGQGYAASMAFQAAILAVFPAVIYLLGSNLAGRTGGVAAATLLALRGFNSIVGASFLNLAGPKQMLTDFPAAVGVALILLTIVPRSEAEAHQPALGIWHGAAVGFAFLIRSTALVLLAVAPLAILLRRPPIGKGMKFLLATWLGFVLFVGPWGARNGARASGGAIPAYLSKARQVWTTRLGFEDLSPAGSKPDAQGNASKGQKPADQADAKQAARSVGMNEPIPISIATHFFHNMIGSVLILPTSPVLNDLSHTVKAADTIWVPRWNGELKGWRPLGLLVALAFLALGVAAVIGRRGLTGLLPLCALLAYYGANSIGATSGGRYLVPVDWIVIVYFLAGVLALLGMFPGAVADSEQRSAPSGAPGARSWITAALMVTLLGATPLLAESPLVFPSSTTETLVDVLDAPATAEALRQAGYSQQEIAAFLQDNKATAISGRVMYPKYFGFRAIADGGRVPWYPWHFLTWSLF